VPKQLTTDGLGLGSALTPGFGDTRSHPAASINKITIPGAHLIR
jgi:hypothetical protein